MRKNKIALLVRGRTLKSRFQQKQDGKKVFKMIPTDLNSGPILSWDMCGGDKRCIYPFFGEANENIEYKLSFQLNRYVLYSPDSFSLEKINLQNFVFCSSFI